MRKASYLVCCALSLGLGVEVASADVVTVSLTGHVVSSSLSGVTVNQAVTATYSYDTLTPLSSDGTYHPASPPASISVSAGGQTFQTQGNWNYQISVIPPGSGPTKFLFQAMIPPPQGGNPAVIAVAFTDFQDQWPTTNALPTAAPSLPASDGSISVYNSDGSNFSVQVDSFALVPSLTISPASSSFVAQQNFDAVVLLSAQISITSMQASVAGTPIPLSYPGTCQLAAPNSAGRVALVCPNASAVLASLGGGPVTITWQGVLGDGTTVQQIVIWNLVH